MSIMFFKETFPAARFFCKSHLYSILLDIIHLFYSSLLITQVIGSLFLSPVNCQSLRWFVYILYKHCASAHALIRLSRIMVMSDNYFKYIVHQLWGVNWWLMHLFQVVICIESMVTCTCLFLYLEDSNFVFSVLYSSLPNTCSSQ